MFLSVRTLGVRHGSVVLNEPERESTSLGDVGRCGLTASPGTCRGARGGTIASKGRGLSGAQLECRSRKQEEWVLGKEQPMGKCCVESPGDG